MQRWVSAGASRAVSLEHALSVTTVDSGQQDGSVRLSATFTTGSATFGPVYPSQADAEQALRRLLQPFDLADLA